MQHYLVIGLGKTGHSIARYLQRHHHRFTMFDTRAATDAAGLFHAEFPDVELFLGDFPEAQLEHITDIIVSPGVPLETPCLLKANVLGIPIYGDIECLARVMDADVIAITGTNGKSTVTSLVGLMAQASGKKTAVAGNIGTPVLDLLADDTDYEVWVLELSSFQLEVTASLRPLAATILNVTPDHLDRHHSLEAYIAAKQRVYLNAQSMLFNRDDLVTQPRMVDSSVQVTSFGLSLAEEGMWGVSAGYLTYGKERILATQDLKIKGRHNWSNALAACALAHRLGISFDVMREVLTTFPGLPHRSQWVRTLNAVDWINDSKGTNIGAAQSAIAGIGDAMTGKIVLIAGGQGKGADFRLLRDCVSTYVRAVIIFGEDAEKLDEALADIVKVVRVTSLEEAVAAAHPIAQPGDVVLLSPACASLDMFRDFNHRGEVFTDLVRKL